MFSICIYDNYDESNLLINNSRQDVQVQTDMDGGFYSANFSVQYNEEIALNYWINKHVVIFDMFGDRVFEGFVDQPRVSGDSLSIGAKGYFDKGDKIAAGPIYFSGQLEGALVTVSVNAGGTGYDVNETLSLTTGGSSGTVLIDEVDDDGAVVAVVLSSYGYGYSVETSATSGGGGSSCTIDIDAVETGSTSYYITRFMTDLNPYWQDDFSRIAELDRTPLGPFIFTRKDKIKGALSKAKQFGYLDTENYVTHRRRGFYYVIYDNRILELRRIPDIIVDEPDWEISIHNIVSKQPLKMNVSGDDIVNHIWIEYNDPQIDGNSFTLGTRHRDSIEKYGLRQEVISIGEGNSDIADIVEDLIIEHRTEPTYSSTLELSGVAYTKHAVPTPLWKIRAGDLIRIMDYDIGIENVGGEKLGAISVVSKTNYNHANRTMKVTLGTGSRLDLILKRLGV